jgi:hypothetical protein
MKPFTNIKTGLKTFLRILTLGLVVAAMTGCRPNEQVPVSVSFRKSLINEGLVAVLSNETSSSVKIVVQLANSTTKESKQEVLLLDALGSKEIGWLQGWAFVPGETLAIQLDGYATKVVKVR